MFKLVIQDDEGKTTVVPLIRDEITIGRKEGNTIRLTERNVSRRHARILRNNGEVQIEDLGSYNGIRVNNARIAERVSLRVSDQVQIGDYKLYLKAEGVEQVDDARTMPIERVEPGTATDVLPAVSPAPTQPVPIQTPPATTTTPTPPPGQVVPGVQIVGTPNRTLVAVADTVEGRPLARPEHIAAAIPQATGYGKLVVLSSNFAGKEFELSRPQMIIGRTDENDLVVNHRSISRNHAKVVREPDTGRYTISDLQSSNGVRVNGQDYGKVELRRGDVIDLGHVRLRFVEPGEDFVFSRDAVITDVPETGGKKGLLVAIVLALLVLGGVVVFFVTRKSDGGSNPGTGTGSEVVNNDLPDASSVSPPPVIDAAEKPAIDGPDTSSVDIKKIVTRCQEAVVKRDWFAVNQCGNDLKAADSPEGDTYVTKGTMEMAAETALRKVREAAKKSDIQEATKALQDIPSDSVYSTEAHAAVDGAIAKLVSASVPDLDRFARARNCDAYNNKLRNLENAYTRRVSDDARKRARKCEPKEVVVAPKPCDSCGAGYVCEDNKCVKKPVVNPCAGIEEVEAMGDTLNGQGSYAAALAKFEQVVKCRPTTATASKAYLAACRAKNFPKAKYYFRNLPVTLAQICMKEGYDPRKDP